MVAPLLVTLLATSDAVGLVVSGAVPMQVGQPPLGYLVLLTLVRAMSWKWFPSMRIWVPEKRAAVPSMEWM